MFCISATSRAVLGLQLSSKFFKNVKENFLQNQRTYLNGINGRVGIIGVPFGKGQRRTGVKEDGLAAAPNCVRGTGFVQDLLCLGIDVEDYGNLTYKPFDEDVCFENMKNLNHVASVNKELYTAVGRILSDDRTCLMLGGDHSLCSGSIYGHMSVVGKDDIAVIYVDAHADINLNTTSHSESIHGMPIAIIAEELSTCWTDKIPGYCEWLEPCFSLKNIAYIGLRSVDPWERHFLDKFGVAAYTMKEIQRYGINTVIEMALKRIDPLNCKSIHLSFDIDSLDPHEAPCTTVPVRGGLTLREGLEIAEAACKTKRVGVVDLVEVSPLFGTEFQRQTTLEAAKHVLLAAFGHSRKGNPPPDSSE